MINIFLILWQKEMERPREPTVNSRGECKFHESFWIKSDTF